MAIKTICGITIMGNIGNYSFHNSKNGAHFFLKDSNVSYSDPYGNHMTNHACHIRINFEPFRLEKMGDEIRKSDGSLIIMMPKEQIEEIANKTFYADGQFHAIDFLTYTITEEK
ncbi:hypothetical protein SOM12_19590 [Flavobacterium sp. CFBP9031]|jgi:hypothetical protein|uniref:hypothetical protein n=1 Tax=unclassified Flavobacterium TaxID=196869 RepID=UPI002A6AE9B0|nr:hypothetical protein [Flavobacterium sp. CFBP9031]MDY0989645.1 hypothetical protein [Flavobacterium sp. CFBP9031]